MKSLEKHLNEEAKRRVIIDSKENYPDLMVNLNCDLRNLLNHSTGFTVAMSTKNDGLVECFEWKYFTDYTLADQFFFQLQDKVLLDESESKIVRITLISHLPETSRVSVSNLIHPKKKMGLQT